MRRRRYLPHAFEDQIAAEKARLKEKIADLANGPERDAMLKKIRQLETASRINEWLTSPGLRSPDKTSQQCPVAGWV
jgi:hypothetical protein